MSEELTLEEAGALAPLVTAQDAARRVADGAVLIDVRSDAGRAEAGELPGARVVAKSRIATLDGLALDTPVVLFCGSVRGSGPSAQALRERGFTNVVHVEGGFPALRAATGAPASPTAQV